MAEMLEMLGSINFTVFKVVGMVISSAAGLIMSWVSMRSVNYRKVDKSMLLASFLFFIYINGILLIISTFATVAILLLGIYNFALLMIICISLTILTILLFWGIIIRKSKHMKAMMAAAKGVSRRLFLFINLISVVSVIVNYVYMPYMLLDQMDTAMAYFLLVISWVCLIWWLTLIVSFIWRTANYIFSEMKITLIDGEIIQYSCSPQMCRVHKNYIRLIERDSKGIIIYEKHINEASIKQIEYS